jgi:BirA family biotin operon repressor/biotin-[acetyl-CoA-carboxylase] ligase
VAVARATREVAGLDVGLKWPNDVLAGDGAAPRKLGGILVESTGTGTVIVGIGLNVDQTAGELPERVSPAPAATSLMREGVGNVQREALAAAVVAHLERQLGRWEEAEGDPERCGLAADYRALCHTLDQRVDVWLPGDEVVSGTAVAVSPEGLLVVETVDGPRSLAAGDVEHVYPSV